MAKELVYTATFKENYQRLPKKIQETFDRKQELFLKDPKHPSLNIHRYHGKDGVWEAYVNEKYRFTFAVTENSLIFRNIGSHGIIDKGKV